MDNAWYLLSHLPATLPLQATWPTATLAFLAQETFTTFYISVGETMLLKLTASD